MATVCVAHLTPHLPDFNSALVALAVFNRVLETPLVNIFVDKDKVNWSHFLFVVTFHTTTLSFIPHNANPAPKNSADGQAVPSGDF
jgi:hypothetical protein